MIATSEPLVTAEDALRGIARSVREERDAIAALVRDEDSDCISRNLRAERVRAYDHVLAVIDRALEWDW